MTYPVNVSPSAQRQDIVKNLHFVWLGKLGGIQQDYIQAWGGINGGEQGYTIKVWYDPQALLASELGRQIKSFAAKDTLIGEGDWVDKVIQLQNQAHREISLALSHQTFDQAASHFICTHLAGSAEKLERIKSDNQASFDHFIANAGTDYVLQDINSLAWQGIDKRYYYQELALRQNFAAASDLLRLEILHQQGGAYFDIDFLPQWKPLPFPAEITTKIEHLQVRGSVNLLKTQLVLEHLQADFPHRQALANANQYHNYAAEFARQSTEHAALVNRLRTFLQSVGHSPSHFFQALGQQKLPPDGIQLAKILWGTSNAAIVAPANSRSLTEVLRQIGNNYRRLSEAGLINIKQSSDISQKKGLEYASKFEHDYGYARNADPQLFLAMDYRLDGLADEAKATIGISGPGAVKRALQKLSHESDPTLPFSGDVFEQFNANTEEDRKHSWLIKTESISDMGFRRVMSRDQLLKEARVPLKPIGTLYQNILTSLYKLHRTRGTERVETAFILKNQIRTYIEKNPNSNRRRAAFLQLEKQINQALFPVAVADFAEVITPIAIEQPTLAKELYRDTFNTTRSYLLDNPVQGQHLDLTDLSLTHNMAIRLEKIIILVDNLASGNKKYHSLDTQDYLLLTDFFHQHDGKLDIKRVILTAFNEVHYLAWRKNVHHGLQLQDLSPQSGLSGQAALQQIQHWNEIQTEGAVALIDAGRNNHEPRVKIDTRLVLQGLYTDNKASHTSHQTPSHTATLALAWLDARSQGERTANQFLTGLEIHTALNEQRADSLLSQQKTQQTDHLRELFNQIKRTLGNQPFFTHQQIAAFNGETGHYLLKVGNHVLALTHQQQGEQYTSLLYAPNIGEMRVTGSDPNDNMRALYAAVQQYLAGKNSVWGSTTRAEHWGLTQVEGQYPVEVFKVNIDTTKERFPELAKLTKLLVDADTKPTQIDATSDTLWSSLHKKRTDWQQIRQMNHYANKIMKKYGYWSGISGIFQYSSLLTRNDLTKRQREDLIFERNITIASMGLDKVQDISLTGMNRYLARLQSANHVIRAGHTHLGIKLFGSRTGQISIHTATKLTKFAAPTLGLLSSSLDIVNAARLFSQLSSEINPDVRRDIIVNASLSTINAAVGISSGVALAAGGRVAVIATPASIAISMAITVVTQNYAAIRTLRTIEKYTRLTFSEKIDNYVQLFWGAGPRAEVQNRIQREQTRENARAYYDRIVDEYADKMVNTSTRGINTVYYSRGDFDLQKNNYRILFVYEIIGRKRNKLRILPLTNQDRIYPEDIPRVKTEYRNHHKYKYFKLHFSERSSQYHYFTPTNLHDVDDVVDASDPLGGLTASVRKTLAVPTSADQRQPDQQAGAMVQEGAILFYLGGGNDVAIGHPNKKNIFQVAAGSKDYTGGQLADVFYLTGAAAPTTASKLNGGKSHGNIIIADSKPSAGTGYNIDLKLGTVRYHEQEALIARIDNIEHAVGHAETNDILIGNQESNHLDGKGGLW